VFIRFTQQSQGFTPPPRTVAVLPLGAVETHGPHLPLGTDGMIAEGILDAAEAADKSSAPTLRLPLLWLGASAEHADRPGTLSQEPEDLIAAISHVGEGLAKCGVERIVLFNGHGGNVAAASIAALKLRTRFGMLAASAHWLDFGLPPGLTPPASATTDVHGGWIETSVLMNIAPHLVADDKRSAREAVPPASSLFPTGNINWGWKLDDLGKGDGGWIGRPDLATPALGKALTDHAAASLLKLLGELAEAAWPRV
jgi:creatinine amidohydrolase